jgi:RimJ/RimL family protein N-acetyltransferase
MIETPRLQLIPCGLAHLETFLRSREEFARLVGVAVPASFPVFDDGFRYWHERLRDDPSLAGWLSYLFVERSERVIVGDGGFKGPPDAASNVEIGYAIVPEYRRRGYATEAARGLTAWAFANPTVAAVSADTLADGEASMRVLTTLGMRQIGTTHDPEEGPLIHWSIRRQDFIP